jgi:putative membrane protein insertion efficiency factor
LSRLAIALIALYKRFLSPLLPQACRFTPTCSDYASMSISKYGFWKGSVKAAGRLMRCHPFHPGGVDMP